VFILIPHAHMRINDGQIMDSPDHGQMDSFHALFCALYNIVAFYGMVPQTVSLGSPVSYILLVMHISEFGHSMSVQLAVF